MNVRTKTANAKLASYFKMPLFEVEAIAATGTDVEARRAINKRKVFARSYKEHPERGHAGYDLWEADVRYLYPEPSDIGALADALDALPRDGTWSLLGEAIVLHDADGNPLGEINRVQGFVRR